MPENFKDKSDAFLKDIGQLVNDIVFLYCEEPLIAPRLWDSLSDDERLAVRYSLVTRAQEIVIDQKPITSSVAPRIVKIERSDVFTRRNTQ
jgi:hypothetical protein